MSTTDVSVGRLRERVTGRVIEPGDADYDTARTVFYGGVDRRPAAIARAADAADVARVVTFARETGAELAVRSGGHSTAGYGVSDGGLVIDLRDMRALEVDAEGRTAWAQTGLTAGEYTTAVAEHGLATGFGDTGSVGIGGITLGGGIGYLVRKHGLTIDDLLEAEVVTADGELLRVGPEQHPDLYWGIRGGGGNFGVATRFRFRLHPLERVVGGMLILPASAEVVASFLRLTAEAPEELSAIVNVMPAPPMPFVPEERHGETIVFALMAYAGPVDDGEPVLAPFRALAEPIADLLRPIPYPEMYPPEDDSYHPTAVGRTMLLDRVDDGAFEAIVDRVAASDAPMRVVQLRALGGAMARVPADATAFGHRSSAIMATAASFYEGDDDRPARVAWVDELAATIRGDAEDRAYANFLGDEGPERVRAAYPGATWDRLREVKRRHDPTNLFRLNQNVPPAGG